MDSKLPQLIDFSVFFLFDSTNIIEVRNYLNSEIKALHCLSLVNVAVDKCKKNVFLGW